MAENVNSLGNRAIESGLRFYNRLANRKNMPVNRRIFLESVLDKSKDPITERSFSNDELNVIGQIILNKYASALPAIDEYETYLNNKLKNHQKAVANKDKDRMMYPDVVAQFTNDLRAIQQFRKGKLTADFLNLASGKHRYFTRSALTETKHGDLFNISPSVQYKDYGVDDPNQASIFSGGNTKDAVMRTLGRFTYEIDPKTGALIILDKYDFNPPINIFTQQMAATTKPVSEGAVATLGAEPGSGGMYGMLRRYAGSTLPPGTGRDVRIQLNSLPPLQPQNMLTK